VSDQDEDIEEPEDLDHLEKVPELEDDQGFGGNPPQTFPGREVEEEEDEAPVEGWDPEGEANGR
jgi:hypothetical protein